MEVREKVKQFIVENFLFGQDGKFGDEDSFLDNGVVDSTGVLELITFVEDHFGVKVEDSELTPDNLDSILKVTRFIERRKALAG